ncbi:MAG: hypothetical protein II864_09705 [Prevotella sp.]|nr:hypothetical protein [Prevotella sp.]MBQ3753804.1 hypothetical protein [Prevotella sp.]
MKTTLRKIALCTLAMLALGGIRMSAATETYDFEAAANELSDASEYYPTYDGTRIFNVQNPSWINIEKMTFTQIELNGRFAAEARSANGFNLRKAGGEWNGLNSGYAAERYFSILNLQVGEIVTITYNQGELKVYSRDGSANIGLADAETIVSGTPYTVTEAGRLDIKTGTYKVNIKKVVIEKPTASVPVTINIISNATTEEYDFQALGQAQTAEGTTDVTFGTEVLTSPASIKQISFGDETFDNRFAGNRDWAIRKHANSAYCGLYNKNGYSGRYLAICNLKAGDKVSIKFICDSEQSLIFKNAIVEGVSANEEVISEQVYVVKTAGALILDEGSNTANKRVYIYKVTIKSAEVLEGDYIGTTLVSDKALDFSEVEGITAYVATAASAGSVTFSPVTKVAANTPLYIKANETSGAVLNVNVPVLNGEAEIITTNLLKGSATTATSLQSTTDTKYYVFGVLNNEAGFYPVSTTSTLTSAAGKAYLELTADQAAASARLNMNFEDSETTAIVSTKSVAVEDDAWYTLQGVRVTVPTKGIYVKNGKKVMVK